MDKNIIKFANFPITAYGKIEKYSDTISKGRCRIFYKGKNRNGSFISDEFAEKLIATLPYAPVKGIYDVDEEDYTDHGTANFEGRIYGIVPGKDELDFQWEKHVDVDGIEREYACVNVYYFTALYKEASEIAGKAQSMELYSKSIKGSWEKMDGRDYYVFTDGAFLGLQVLGEDVEPCFEGAAFYSLVDSLKDFAEKWEKYEKEIQANGEGGDDKMEDNLNFKISDNKKYDLLWKLLNSNYNAEGGWKIDCCLCEVYDEYAVAYDIATESYKRVYYTKNDEEETIAIDREEECFIIDVNANEKKALNAIHDINNTFENLDENYNSIVAENEKSKEEISEYSTKIEELNNTISTLSTEKDEINNQFSAAKEELESVKGEFAASQESLTAMTAERDDLASYKKNVEVARKQSIVERYTSQLDEDIIAKYTENLDNYDDESLDMNLTYELKKAHPDMFGKDVAPALIRKDDTEKDGLALILDRYERKI